MLFRWLLGITIIGVAVAMTTALVRLVYFPEESRLAREDPQLVFERFLSRDHFESNLDIWKGPAVVGNLRVTPYRLRPDVAQRVQGRSGVRAYGHVEVALPGLGVGLLRFHSDLKLAPDGSVAESELELSSNKFPQTLNIDHEFQATAARISMKQDGVTLLDTGAKIHGGVDSDPMVQILLRSIGVNADELKKRQTQAAQSALESPTEARRGGFTVLGHEFHGYVLTTTLGGLGKKFTLYVSDSGELIQMKTSFLDYQFISEDLRPDGTAGPVKTQPIVPPHP